MDNHHQNINKENQLTLLKNAIREGIKSGRANDFEPKKHLALLKAIKALKD